MPNAVSNSVTILASASRADTTTKDYSFSDYRGAEFFVTQTAQGSTTAFVSVKVQGRVPGSTEYYTVGTISPATAATFTKRLRIYPGASTALNSTGLDPTVLNDFLPPVFRIATTNISTSAVTFAVSANLFA